MNCRQILATMGFWENVEATIRDGGTFPPELNPVLVPIILGMSYTELCKQPVWWVNAALEVHNRQMAIEHERQLKLERELKKNK